MNPYKSDADCLAFAKSYTLGTVENQADKGNSTLACRMYHANFALGMNSHCPHTGPDGGDGPCGTKCDAFCDMHQKTCTGGNSQYGTVADCKTACAGWAIGTFDEMVGNTFHCRFYHLKVAVTTGPVATHCPHVGPNGGGQCIAAAASTSQSPVPSTDGSEKLFALFVMIIFIFI